MPLYANPSDPSIEFKDEIQAFIQEQKKIKDSIAQADSLRKAKYSKKFTYKKTTKTQSYKKTKNYYKSQPNHSKSQAIISTPIELNSADTSSLISVRGIGHVFSRRILKYRKLLGGFYKKNQLLEVYGIDSIAFSNIEKQITVDTALIEKININTAEFKQALKHPYLKYEDVKAIFGLKKGRKKITKKKLDNIKLSNKMILKYLELE